MDTTGIICEYNPFHRGHEYHLSETRRSFPDTTVICLMSGSFVQRGEPAILSKHSRARAAIQSGADIVLELPFPFSLLPAQLYAQKAVFILNALGVNRLSFGAETADAASLTLASQRIYSPEFEKMFSEAIKANRAAGFPSVRAAEYKKLYGDSSIIESPNNILAIEYIYAIKKYASQMSLFPVPRIGESERSMSAQGKFPSAAAIRAEIMRGDSPSGLTKASLEETEREKKDSFFPAALKNAEDIVLYTLRKKSPEELSECFGVGELAFRLVDAAKKSSSFAELLENFSLKHTTLAREKRAILSAFFGITKEEAFSDPRFTSLLAANRKGLLFLKSQRKSPFPIITKPASYKEQLGKDGIALYERMLEADDAYFFFTPVRRSAGAQLTTTPYIFR